MQTAPIHTASCAPAPPTCTESLACHAGGAREVLVGAVGAAANERGLEVGGPAVLAAGVRKLGQGRGQVGREGAVDVGLQLAQVDLNELVVLAALVRHQVLPEEATRTDHAAVSMVFFFWLAQVQVFLLAQVHELLALTTPISQAPIPWLDLPLSRHQIPKLDLLFSGTRLPGKTFQWQSCGWR